MCGLVYCPDFFYCPFIQVLLEHPEKIGIGVGFENLTPMHGEWIRQMVFGEEDYTLQAHRGSYKSSCLAVSIALLMVLYFEFQIQAHKSPHFVVNAYKIQRINKVLEPLREIMRNEPYTGLLEKLEEPKTIRSEDGEEEKTTGLDYGDIALALTQYKGAMTRFSADRL